MHLLGCNPSRKEVMAPWQCNSTNTSSQGKIMQYIRAVFVVLCRSTSLSVLTQHWLNLADTTVIYHFWNAPREAMVPCMHINSTSTGKTILVVVLCRTLDSQHDK